MHRFVSQAIARTALNVLAEHSTYGSDCTLIQRLCISYHYGTEGRGRQEGGAREEQLNMEMHTEVGVPPRFIIMMYS